ncbi:argininosuccinate lyase [Ponticoccus litoralis]|uniref:Argininosuccinate lyase n=1 Tax=Ponticoccus litoralis TaxID=422297 RepID=A0AAW9S927_9RHOB
MKRLGLILVMVTLAACGADGEPERPGTGEKAGVTVTGTAKVGIGSR